LDVQVERDGIYTVLMGKALEKLRSRSNENIKKDILGRKVVRI